MTGKTVPPATIYSIGHSNHTIERFLDLLRGAGIETVLDVRSIPHSRRFPQFGRAKLETSLRADGIGYVFLGGSLGGKPTGGGPVDYEEIAATAAFSTGLMRAEQEGAARRVALMCAEKAPLDCHRTVLIARHLADRGQEIMHVLADGTTLPHAAIEEALLKRYAPADDLLTHAQDRGTRLAQAYRRRGEKMTAGTRR